MSSQKPPISIVRLLSMIPKKEIDSLARITNVNHYVKVLDGSSLFYLLMYSMIECQRNSLRTMEDIFNSTSFKFLFNLNPDKKVKYNSISERLSMINIKFFEKVYELIYTIFSNEFSKDEIEQHKLIRVDSTMVAESSAKLKQGMNIGKVKDGKKQVKYTISYDGNLPNYGKIFTDKKNLSEDTTIPEVINEVALKKDNTVFLFDRGVAKRDTFDELSTSNTKFICRLKANAKYKILSELKDVNNHISGSLVLKKDLLVKLYTKKKETKNDFRLITSENPTTKERLLFLTNILDENPEEILASYKKRWDIEVFFRFLKQELNFSHLFSTNENGIQVIMYMTLITSMLVLIYKRKNGVGYKTAVRRISLELNEVIIKLIVKYCGGDPSLVFR